MVSEEFQITVLFRILITGSSLFQLMVDVNFRVLQGSILGVSCLH